MNVGLPSPLAPHGVTGTQAGRSHEPSRDRWPPPSKCVGTAVRLDLGSRRSEAAGYARFAGLTSCPCLGNVALRSEAARLTATQRNRTAGTLTNGGRPATTAPSGAATSVAELRLLAFSARRSLKTEQRTKQASAGDHRHGASELVLRHRRRTGRDRSPSNSGAGPEREQRHKGTNGGEPLHPGLSQTIVIVAFGWRSRSRRRV